MVNTLNTVQAKFVADKQKNGEQISFGKELSSTCSAFP